MNEEYRTEYEREFAKYAKKIYESISTELQGIGADEEYVRKRIFDEVLPTKMDFVMGLVFEEKDDKFHLKFNEDLYYSYLGTKKDINLRRIIDWVKDLTKPHVNMEKAHNNINDKLPDNMVDDLKAFFEELKHAFENGD